MYKDLSLDHEFALVTGSGINVDDFMVYPLTLREIGQLGFQVYQELLSTVLITKDMLDDLPEEDLNTIVDFDIVASNCLYNEHFKQMAEKSLSIFLKEEVYFLSEYQFFIVGDISDPNKVRTINRDNFEKIADTIRLQNMLERPKPKPKKPKMSKRMMELQAKRDRGRKIMAEAKKQKNEIKITDIINTVATFIEDYNTIMDWTVYQVHLAHNNLLKKEGYRERFDMYIAGGDPKKLQLDTHWSRLKD